MPTLKFIVAPEHADQRIDVFLAAQTKKSRTVVQEQLKNNRVSLNSRPLTKHSIRLQTGDEVSINFLEEEHPSLEPVEGPLNIIFEDEHLLVINKEQGVVVHPAAGHRGDTLVHHLLHYLGESHSFVASTSVRPGIVHRLDKGTSGVLLVAKTRYVQDALSHQFKEREVKKEYESLVWGKILREGVLKNPIGRDRVHRQKMSSKTSQGRSAETRFRPVEIFQSFTHLMVFPLTGRTHQIRVHLSEFGHSIVGDPTYGKGLTAKRSDEISAAIKESLLNLEHPFLHAHKLTFTHPVSKQVLQFEAPRPKTFDNVLDLLRKENSL